MQASSEQTSVSTSKRRDKMKAKQHRLRLLTKQAKLQPLICKVCGDQATGFNFGALVCESCKSFYRRHAHGRPQFRCATNGKCQLQLSRANRRRCGACRLRKCFAVGMLEQSACEFLRQAEQFVIPADKQMRRTLLVSRLRRRIDDKSGGTVSPSSAELVASLDSENQTIAERSSESQSSSSRSESPISSTHATETNVDEYQQIFQTVRDAASYIGRGLSSSNGSCTDTSRRPLDGSCDIVQLAFRGYLDALRCFGSLVRLDRPTYRALFIDRWLSQIELFTMFGVDEDLNGWRAVDGDGSVRWFSFDEYVDSMDRDGVGAEARDFVESFRSLTGSFRERFASGWGEVLVVLCIIDFLSPQVSTITDSQPAANQLFAINSETNETIANYRALFKRFLRSYLRINYGNRSQCLYEFCSNEFPRFLNSVVEKNLLLLADFTPYYNGQSSPQKERSATIAGNLGDLEPVINHNHQDVSLDLRLVGIFDPVISRLVCQLTI